MLSLTQEQRAALVAIRDGADVYSYSTAKLLRELKDAYKPPLLRIVKCRTWSGHPIDPKPYFGAIATATGRRVLRGIRAQEDLPPCIAEAFRDTAHDLQRRAAGVED